MDSTERKEKSSGSTGAQIAQPKKQPPVNLPDEKAKPLKPTAGKVTTPEVPVKGGSDVPKPPPPEAIPPPPHPPKPPSPSLSPPLPPRRRRRSSHRIFIPRDGAITHIEKQNGKLQIVETRKHNPSARRKWECKHCRRELPRETVGVTKICEAYKNERKRRARKKKWRKLIRFVESCFR